MKPVATDQIVVRPLNHPLPCLDVFISYQKQDPSEVTQQFIEEIQRVFAFDLITNLKPEE